MRHIKKLFNNISNRDRPKREIDEEKKMDDRLIYRHDEKVTKNNAMTCNITGHNTYKEQMQATQRGMAQRKT